MGMWIWLVLIVAGIVGYLLWKRYRDVQANNQRLLDEVEQSKGKRAVAIATHLFNS